MQLNVPYIRQTSAMDCWHAAVRMIYAYKKKMSPNPAPSLYQSGGGLAQAQNCASVAAMARQIGMQAVPLQPANEKQLEAALTQYGPLWLPLTDASGKRDPHIVVLTGVEKGKLYINDPAEPSNVSQQDNKKVRDWTWFCQFFARATGLLYLP
jgi:ABC-type bacteriocin/lantibiotic exporter with double-glycine peptidase domain